MREASSLVLAARLLAEGAEVVAYDPVVDGAAERLHGVVMRPSAEAAEGADALVLVTEWPEFLELDLAAVAATMRGNTVIDGRNFLDAVKVREAGLLYEGIGRPALKDREPARTA
jgi:UDPglucose 6-dehydrogenase